MCHLPDRGCGKGCTWSLCTWSAFTALILMALIIHAGRGVASNFKQIRYILWTGPYPASQFGGALGRSSARSSLRCRICWGLEEPAPSGARGSAPVGVQGRSPQKLGILKVFDARRAIQKYTFQYFVVIKMQIAIIDVPGKCTNKGCSAPWVSFGGACAPCAHPLYTALFKPTLITVDSRQ